MHLTPEQQLKELCEIDGLTVIKEEFGDYEKSLQKSEQELLAMLDMDLNNIIEEVTFDHLSKITFNKARQIISLMSIKKRIAMLKDVGHHLDHLYQVTSQYNDQGFGKSMAPKVFQSIMGKIKHFETLTSWLYGIE